MQLGTDAGRRAWPPAGWTAQNAEERADRQGPAHVKPGIELLHAQRSIPTSRRRRPFPARTSTAPRWRSRSVSASANASLIRSPARQSTMTTPRSLIASGPSPAAQHHGDDLLHGWRVRRIAKPFVARHAALVKPGQGRLRPAAPGTIQQSYRFHDVLLWTTVDPRSSRDATAACVRSARTARSAKMLATRHRLCANEPTRRGRQSCRELGDVELSKAIVRGGAGSRDQDRWLCPPARAPSRGSDSGHWACDDRRAWVSRGRRVRRRPSAQGRNSARSAREVASVVDCFFVSGNASPLAWRTPDERGPCGVDRRGAPRMGHPRVRRDTAPA